MDKNELERRLEAAEKQMIGLQDEIQNLKSHLAEMQDEPDIPDFPKFKRESVYWSVDDEFALQKSIHSGYVGEKGIKDDEALYNAFHTEEYAQEFANKCKLIAMMLHCKWYIDRNALDTSEETCTYGTCYDKENKKFVLNSYCLCEPCEVTFRSAELAQKCVDWLNKHWSESDD